jgi:hypothetical protein
LLFAQGSLLVSDLEPFSKLGNFGAGFPAQAVHHVELREVVAQARLAVVRIVCGGEFYCTSTKRLIDEVVGNDRYRPLNKRYDDAPPHECCIARVGWMHSNAGVAKKRLWPGRCHDHAGITRATFEWVANLPDTPLLFGGNRLKI